MKVLKPAVHLLRTAGFLFVSLQVATLWACKIGDDGSQLPNGLQVTEGSVNGQLLTACDNYCGQMYGSPSECDEDVLAEDQVGCEAFCGVQAKRVPDQCEDLFIEFYGCVVTEDITYECDSEDNSPIATDPTCEELYSQANDCLSGLSTTG